MIAKTIRTCFPIAAAAVSEKAEEINKLNVFPVPDGDTGTNMSLTLASVVKELNALPEDADMEAIAAAITHGSLMGARGNSGVITSQILRGVAEGLVGADEPTTSAEVAAAFRRAVKVAFKAVRKPIEGTILTVLRDVSTKADECEKRKFTVEEALDALVVEAYESVARTPDLLPVLKENGVVDSGAFGFAIFLENFVAAALGRRYGRQRQGRRTWPRRDRGERRLGGLGVPLLQRVPLPCRRPVRRGRGPVVPGLHGRL